MTKLSAIAVALSIFISHLFRSATSQGITYTFPDCTVAPLKSNAVCDTTKDPVTRAQAIISEFTVSELISNTVNLSPGVARLGLPAYQWWSEALHGVASSPGVTFAPVGSNFSFATSFPQPILMGAAFDDELIKDVATVISTEARAFNNFGRAGIDFFTPNINPFKDPRWGRGQETPGEDPFHISQYVFNLIQGLQGGIDPKPYIKVVADCKHFAGYDLENWEGNSRMSFNAVITPQDLSEYYLPSFQSCVRDARVASVMCSYNSVNGIPSCANSYLLQSLLRDYWGFNDEGRWVTSDCDAVDNIFSTHHYTADYPHAVADALKAGTDVDCGTAYSLHLPDAFNQSLITKDDLEKALVRQYSSLVRLGYFDSPKVQPFRQLDWSDVNTPAAQALALKAAAEGIVLLKNDGTLPFKKSIKKLAFIGPWANATTQMQGNYEGIAPFLVSPMQGAINTGFSVTFAFGTSISGTDTSGFAEALAAAKAADAIVFAALDLISQLSSLGKPLVVMQFGGGQVDGTEIKNNTKVNSILWAGYPGQSGGTALGDIISGKTAPAGRLATTQYPASYINQVNMTDMNLRPSSTNPGRTYKWFTGTPVFEFGHGLHFTTFAISWQHQPSTVYQIPPGLTNQIGKSNIDLNAFETFNVVVKNTGKVASDYVALLFLSGNGGPAPLPNKQLVSYTRLQGIEAGRQSVATLQVTLGSIARADANGNLWLYPGKYELTVDTGTEVYLTHSFELEGSPTQISKFPQDSS
ncbi:glycoside hydrolase family 3 protein [Gymnopilus junonius]|uniref:xylan 1,4-beta-xylosidase n=1 Tax=Gymnopilus junonius TaxID=109634 RepID=A0A9P5P3E6_GYMJU|nr:glycoside hydrolase family 3 protein [Gymnopilus junonius]